MLFPSQEFWLIKEEIKKARRILLISHAGPDGDTVGSNLAMRLVLTEQLKKEVVSACFDPIPQKFAFLTGSNLFVQDFDVSSFDLIIALDIAAKHLIKFHETKPGLLNGATKLINIDHHYSNDGFGHINLVLQNAAAVAVIIYDFFEYCGFTITKAIATSLLTGIYYDTGGLKHSNTDQKTYNTAAKLLKKGACLPIITRHLFHSTSVPKMRLWGKIFENMYVSGDKVIVSAVTERDFVETQTTPEDLSGIIEYLNMVPDANFCVMLSADQTGKVKGSLRTLRDDTDVAAVANKYGGGGHKQASGFIVQGKLEQEIRWKVVERDGKETILEFRPNKNTASLS